MPLPLLLPHALQTDGSAYPPPSQRERGREGEGETTNKHTQVRGVPPTRTLKPSAWSLEPSSSPRAATGGRHEKIPSALTARPYTYMYSQQAENLVATAAAQLNPRPLPNETRRGSCPFGNPRSHENKHLESIGKQSIHCCGYYSRGIKGPGRPAPRSEEVEPPPHNPATCLQPPPLLLLPLLLPPPLMM